MTLDECLPKAFQQGAVLQVDAPCSFKFLCVIDGKAFTEDGDCVGNFSRTQEQLSNLFPGREWHIRYLSDRELRAVRTVRGSVRASEKNWHKKKLSEILEV